MNTIESKKLIAAFMGFPLQFGGYVDIYPDKEYCESLPMLEYHFEDWDALMPVISKIDKLMLDMPVIIAGFDDLTESIFSSLREVNISLTIQRVIQFIILYNKNQQS